MSQLEEEQELQPSELSEVVSPPMPLEKALKRESTRLDELSHSGQLVSSSILLIERSNSNFLSQLVQWYSYIGICVILSFNLIALICISQVVLLYWQ